jgi:ABC-type uncharacterized transport system permease subunit
VAKSGLKYRYGGGGSHQNSASSMCRNVLNYKYVGVIESGMLAPGANYGYSELKKSSVA